jgi:hypothetical protein
MTATLKSDAPSPPSAAPVRINREVYRTLASARGYTSVEAQAAWHGVHRSTMFELLAGRTVPRLDLAMRMARDCQTTVDFLFEWAA